MIDEDAAFRILQAILINWAQDALRNPCELESLAIFLDMPAAMLQRKLRKPYQIQQVTPRRGRPRKGEYAGGRCPVCDAPLLTGGRGRPAKFCSQRCAKLAKLGARIDATHRSN